MIDYKVTSRGIKLIDSYKVSKWDFLHELEGIRLKTFGSDVWKRSMTSLMREWCVHNVLSALGIARERTGSVDLNYPLKWYASAAYWLLGAIVWFFIK